MTKNRFHLNLFLLSLLPIAIIAVSIIDLYTSQDPKIFRFLKEMSSYILLLMAPIIANIFSLRQKFIEKIENEWRRIVETKSKLLIFLEKSEQTEDEYIEIYFKLSQDIDYLRAIYRNVGEDKKYIGLYPYETLHDFRRAIEQCRPKSKSANLSKEIKAQTRNSINESFKAFRDVYLIELAPPEPDFPIIRFNMRRIRKDGMTKKNEDRAFAADERLMKRFGLEGQRNKEL